MKRPVSLIRIAFVAILASAFLGCAAKEAVPPQSPEAIVPDGPAPTESESTKGPLEEKLSPETIQSVMRESYDQFRACYEAGLGRDAKLTGRVTVRFVIADSGKVTSADILEESELGARTDLTDREMLDCLLGAYRKLEFPASKGQTKVVYPIRFSPE